MYSEDDRKWLYERMQKAGVNTGSYDDFKTSLSNDEDRKWYYEKSKALGLDVGTQQDFDGMMVESPAPDQSQQVLNVTNTQGQQQTQAGQQTVEVSGDGTFTEEQLAAIDAGAKPVVGNWKPTWQQRQAMQIQLNGMQQQIDQMAQQREAMSQRMENARKAVTRPVEKKLNPQTGKFENVYYTTRGDEVSTPFEQSRLNLRYRDEWEATTPEGAKSRERRIKTDYERNVEAALPKYDRENTALIAWQNAENRAKEEFSAYLEERRKPTLANALHDMADAANVTGGLGAENVEYGIKAFESNLKYHDLQSMADEAWNLLGKEKQEQIIEQLRYALRNRYPGADESQIDEAAKEMARQKSDERMYNVAVYMNAPKSATELFLRKAVMGTSIGKLMEAAAREKAGTTGDMEARDVAEQQYAQNHKFANIAGTVTSFGIDPLTWASAGAGNATVRGSMWLGGRLFGQAATRRFATTLTGRMLSGSLGAAANLGTFEAGTEIADQARWGGKMTPNPFTGRYEVGDYSAGAVFGRFGHGAMMGTATGIVAPLLGNVSNKLVQSTESTAGKLGIRAGELGVGTVAEGTIFSVPEIIETYGQYNDMIESLSDPNSQYYIADETERAAKIEEMRSKRGDAMMDVWTDNMAMMAGFKLQHGLKSAPRTIAELSQSPGRLKTGFETRLRSILDGRSDLALTVDEKAELERGGYKDLTELTDDYQRYLANPPQRGGERITDPNRQIGSDMPENVSGGLPYNRFVELMNDGNISEAARAKMYYYITGHSLPMSTVMGSRMVENRDADGNLSGYIVESVGANGVITSRSFANKKSAEVEVNRINRQAELNSVDVGEQYAEAAHEQRRVKAACEKASEQTGVASSELEKLMQTDPAKMTDAQKALVDVVRGAYDELGEEFEHRQNKWYRKQVSMTPKAIREHINEVFGVDVDKAIRKEPDRRSEKEQQAVNEYVQRLFNEAEAETRESEAGEEAAPGQWDADMNGQRLLSRNEQDNGEGPGGEAGANDGTGANEPSGDTPPVDVPPRGNNGGGSTPSAAYSRGQEAIKSGNAVGVRDIGHEVSLADARMARVFGNNQDLLRQAYEAVESGQTDAFLSANGEALNEAQTDAVRKLADAVEVMRGVDEAIEEQVAMTSQQTEEDIKPYQNEQGDIIPIQLINGVTVYHKNGDLNNQYGTVNVAYAGKDGQPKTAQVAHKDIQQVGQPMTPEAFVQHQTRQQREANERKYKSWIDGTDFTTGNSLDLTVAGHTDTFTIKGFFANGDMQLADADGNAIRMTKEEVTQFLQATETKRIEEELSGEMAAWREQARQQREAARAAAEAERQERFRNGIVGYSESKPDYSAPESDPAVVAEYLLSLAENGQKMPGEEGTDTTAEDGEGRAAAREKVLKNIQGEKDLLLQNEQQARQQWQEAQDWLDANDGISDPVEQAKAIQQRRGAELALQNISERQKKWAAVRDQIMTKAEKEAFMQERRQRISSLRPKNVDIADNIEPYQTVYEENGIDVTNDEAISKHLLDTYQEQGDAQAAINAERITLRNYQRDQVQPEIDRLRGVVDDYVQGRSEYDDATLRQAVGDLAQLEAYQSALTAKARDLKSVVDRLPNIYADRNKAAFAELPAAYQRMSRFDRAKTLQDKLRIAREVYSGDEAARAVFDDIDIPRDAMELVAMNMPLRGISWEGYDQGEHHVRGLQEELGSNHSRGIGRGHDVNAFHTYLAPKGQGRGIEEVVHDIYENQPEVDGEKRYDTQEIRNALLELITTAEKPTDIRDYVVNRRIEEAEEIMQAAEEYEARASELAEMEQPEYLAAAEWRETADVSWLTPDVQAYFDGAYAEYAESLAGDPATYEDAIRQLLTEDAEQFNALDYDRQRNDEEADAGSDRVDEVAQSAGVEERGRESQESVSGTQPDKQVGVSGHQAEVPGRSERASGSDRTDASLPVQEARGREGEQRVDAALTPATDAERDAVAATEQQLQQEIADAEEELRKARTSLQKAESKESNRATDMFADDNAFKEQGQLFDFEEMPADRSAEGVKSRTKAERDAVAAAEQRLSQLKSDAEHHSRVRGTLDNIRRQTDAFAERPAGEAAGTTAFAERLTAAKGETDTQPTEAQKAAGNYKKGHITFGGYTMSIENPKGSVRSGVDRSGKPWSITMHDTYGYIGKKYGADGDHLDFFVNDDADLDTWNGRVFIVDQKNDDGTFDEHKVMYGYPSWAMAKKAYEANYEPGWWDKHVMQMMGVKKGDFDKWLNDSDHKRKPFAEYFRTRILSDAVGSPVEELIADIKERQQKPAINKWGVDASTPLGKQFTTLKEKFPDPPVLLFRDGDDYKVLGVDVPVVSQLTDGKTNGSNGIQTFTFPAENIDTTLPALIRAGHQVAIADPMEAPKKTVRRGITETVEKPKAVDDLFGSIDFMIGDITSEDEAGTEKKSENSFRLGNYLLTLQSQETKEAVAGQCKTLAETSPWRDGVEDVVVHTTLSTLRKKYGDLHEKAKAGDIEAAVELVSNVVKPEKVKSLAELHPNAKVAFVHAEEATGRNALPVAYATYLEQQGLSLDENIVQVNKCAHTGSDRVGRFMRRARFGGNVESGAEYIIVDDHVTMGSTLRDLKDYIESKGGKVVAVSTLTASAGGTKLRPTEEQIKQLNEKGISNEQLKELGIADSIDGLTRREAAEILVLADKGGDSRVARGQEAGDTEGPRVLGEEENRIDKAGEADVVSLPRINDYGLNENSPIGRKLSRLKKQAGENGLVGFTDAETGDYIFLGNDAEKIDQSTNLKSTQKGTIDGMPSLIVSADDFDTVTPVMVKKGYKFAITDDKVDDVDKVMSDAQRRNDFADKKEAEATINDFLAAKPQGTVDEQIRQRATKAVLKALSDAGVPYKVVSKEEERQMLSLFSQMNEEAVKQFARNPRIRSTSEHGRGRYIVYNMENPFGVPMYAEKQSVARWILQVYKQLIPEGTWKILDIGEPGQEAQQNNGLRNAADMQAQIGYHGSGAEFDAFDHSHMGEGEGNQTYGWGTYVTEVVDIGRMYAQPKFSDQGAYSQYKSDKQWLEDNDTYEKYLANNKERTERVVDYMQKNLDAATDPDVKKFYTEEIEKANEKITEPFYQQEYAKILGAFQRKYRPGHLYRVEIPDDSGSNYFDWTQPVPADRADKILSTLRERLLADEQYGWNTPDGIKRLDDELEAMKSFFGGAFYSQMSVLLGNSVAGARIRGKRMASELLHEMGYVGIKYPAEMMSGGREDDAMNHVIFKEDDAKIVGHIQFMLDKENGGIYGWTDGKQIFLTERGLNPNSPVHEYTHIWASYMEKHNPELWSDIVKAMKQTDMWRQIRQNPNYRGIWENENKMASEVLSRLSGAASEEEFTKAATGNKKGSADIIRSVKNALKKFWDAVVRLFSGRSKTEASPMSSYQAIVRMPLRDLLEGFNPIERNPDGEPSGTVAIMQQRGDVVERTLMGVHNLTEEKLRKVLKQGGLANPSMAVIDTKGGYVHTDYGGISLIPRASLIDARTGKNAGTFTADAWTPSYPPVSLVLKSKGWDKFFKDIRDMEGTAGSEVASKLRLYFEDYLDGREPDAMYWWYLHDRGKNPDIVTNGNPYGKETTDKVMALLDNGHKALAELSQEDMRQLADLYHAYKQQKGEEVTPAEQSIANIQERLNNMTGDDAKTQYRKQKMQGYVEQLQQYGETLGNIENFTSGVYHTVKRENELNHYTTFLNARKRVEDEGLSSDYHKWLEELSDRYGIEEKIFDGYTYSGNKKYIPNTLENVSRYMKKQGLNGATNWSSIGNWVAKVANKEKTLEGIRKHKKNLNTTKEEHDAFLDKWGTIMHEIAVKMGEGDGWAGEQRMTEALGYKDIAGYVKREYGVDLSQEDKDNIATFIKEVQTNFPTGYFETKFERPVMLDEFAVAVVPMNTSEDVVKALEDAGLDVRRYDNTGNLEQQTENRRLATMEAVQSRDDIMFQVENEPTDFSIRHEAAPKKTGIGYKVFYLHDGKLYPPMVANPDGADTPVGVWLNADDAPVVTKSKTGRDKVKAGGKGTQGGSGTLAHRPGWHLGEIPYALQFNRGEKVDNPLGITSKKGDIIKVGKYFPGDFVWGEVEYADDKNYQKEAESYGYNEAGNFQHSLAGLPRIPVDGSYRYRTNANPATDPWIITGAMKVNRVLKPSEVDQIVKDAGREPQEREAGAVTDADVQALNDAIESRRNEQRTAQELATDAVMQALQQTGKHYSIVSQEEAASVLSQQQRTGKEYGKQLLRTSDGVVYGYSDGVSIKLTEAGINPETPAHEYDHLWVKAVKRERPDLWENIKSLMKEDAVSQRLYQKLLGNEHYQQIHGDEDRLYEEVLTSMAGKKNRERFEQAAREVLEEAQNSPDGKASGTTAVMRVLSRIRNAFHKLWSWIGKDLFKIEKFRSVDEVTDRMMYDFVNGNDLNTGGKTAGHSEGKAAAATGTVAEFQVGRGKPRQKKGESAAQYFQRLREWERRRIVEETDPEPVRPEIDGDPFSEEYRAAYEEYRRAHEEWEIRNQLHEEENIDMRLYEEANGLGEEISEPQTEEEALLESEVDARVMQDLGDAVGYDATPEGAKEHVRLAVIERRKCLESASAEDAIWLHDLTKRIKEIAKHQGVKEKDLREALPDIIEGTYFEDVLRDENGNVVAINDISDQLPIKKDAELSALLDDIKDWYDEFYHLIEEAGLRNDAGYIPEGYVNHIWDKAKSDPQAWDNFVRTRSANMKHREIYTYREGREIGLVPKYTDIIDILSYYSRQNNEAIANKRLLDDVAYICVNEVNSDGEVTATVPILSSVEPDILTREFYGKPYEIPSMGNVWVHKAVERPFATVFGPIRQQGIAPWLTKLGGRYDKLGAVMKKINLSLSGFHALALTETALAQMGPIQTMRALLKDILWDSAIMRKGKPAFAKPEDFEFAAKHLVQLGATQDYAAADVRIMTERIRDGVRRMVREPAANASGVVTKAAGAAMMPFTEALDAINKGMDAFLWDYIHDGLKISCMRMLRKQIDRRARKQGLPDDVVEKMYDEAGQYVNDIFGGQYWELLNVSPSDIKWAGRFIMSPDWNVSTTRQALAVTGFGSLYSEQGFKAWLKYHEDNMKRMAGKAASAATFGKAGKAWREIPHDEYRRVRSMNAKVFWLLSLPMIYAVMNAINAIARKKDEEEERAKAEEIRKTNPNYKSPYELAYPDGMKWYDYVMPGNSIGQQTHLFAGRYADGTERYIRWGKQFRELPEMFIGRHGVEFPAPMIERLKGKSNPMIGFTLDGLGTFGVHGFSTPYDVKEEVSKYGKTIAFLSMTAKHFLPYSVPTQDDKEFYWSDLFMPSSKGFSPWKALDYFKTYILAGDMNGIEQTYNACVMNNIDAEKTLQAAIASVRASQRKELAEGVVDLPTAFERFNAAETLQEKKQMRNKIVKYLAEQNYKVFTREEALQKAQGIISGEDVNTAEKDDDQYVMACNADDVRDDYKLTALMHQSKQVNDRLSEMRSDGVEPALIQEYAERQRSWLQMRKIITNGRKQMNQLKKKLGQGDDETILEQIRDVRRKMFDRIDRLNLPEEPRE